MMPFESWVHRSDWSVSAQPSWADKGQPLLVSRHHSKANEKRHQSLLGLGFPVAGWMCYPGPNTGNRLRPRSNWIVQTTLDWGQLIGGRAQENKESLSERAEEEMQCKVSKRGHNLFSTSSLRQSYLRQSWTSKFSEEAACSACRKMQRQLVNNFRVIKYIKYMHCHDCAGIYPYSIEYDLHLTSKQQPF